MWSRREIAVFAQADPEINFCLIRHLVITITWMPSGCSTRFCRSSFNLARRSAFSGGWSANSKIKAPAISYHLTHQTISEAVTRNTQWLHHHESCVLHGRKACSVSFRGIHLSVSLQLIYSLHGLSFVICAHTVQSNVVNACVVASMVVSDEECQARHILESAELRWVFDLTRRWICERPFLWHSTTS